MFSDYFTALLTRLHHDEATIALVDADGTLSYAQLGRRVGAILCALDAFPGTGPVLIRGHKAPDVVAAMIASTVANRGFVFAETSYPEARLHQIIETCACSVLLDTGTPCLDVGAIPRIDSRDCADQALPALTLAKDMTKDWVKELAEDQVFYITFTSGSTGQPKGIPITRRNFAAFADWSIPMIAASSGGAYACVNHASMAFDMSMSDVWPTLFSSRALYLLDHKNNTRPHANIALLTRHPEVPAGVLMSTPAFLSILLESPHFNAQRLPMLRDFWFGGDSVTKALLRRLRGVFPECDIHHGYGPSEATCVTHGKALCPADLLDDGPLPLGRAAAGTLTLVDTGDGVLRPTGEGEIVLVGDQVAMGYLPASHPNNSNFGTHEGKRSYRTGDLGCLSESGDLTISGRLDTQVKINGQRIELGEIEHCALQLPGINRAVVVARSIPSFSLLLVIAGDNMHAQTPEILRAHLAQRLPAYMCPNHIEMMDALPLSLAGKVDRKVLTSLFA